MKMLFRGNSYMGMNYLALGIVMCGICFTVVKDRLKAVNNLLVHQKAVYSAVLENQNEMEIEGVK